MYNNSTMPEQHNSVVPCEYFLHTAALSNFSTEYTVTLGLVKANLFKLKLDEIPFYMTRISPFT